MIRSRQAGESCCQIFAQMGGQVYRGRQGLGKVRMSAITPGLLGFRALFHRREQFVESLGEETNAVVGKLVGYLLHVDTNLSRGFHGVMGSREILGKALTQLSMIAEGVEGGRRNSVYRIRPDQLFDVQHVAIGRVLSAGAGPEHALGLRLAARAFQRGVLKISWYFSYVCFPLAMATFP